MKKTAIAPANIAFIKYWGKANEALRLPLNSSISMNLSGCTTITTVEFSPERQVDDITFLQSEDSPLTTKRRPRYVCQSRISQHLDRLRQRAGTTLYAKVMTSNTFPSAAGIASSASGFAALTVAAAAALGLTLSEKELTTLARLGSGSACRSIPDGFVMWTKGNSSASSYAYSLYPPEYWELRDILVITKASQKKIPSAEGMEKIRTSPFWNRRLRDMPDKIKTVKKAFAVKNFRMLGETIEEETINMHTIMMTQKPPLYYWNGVTMEIIRAARIWRGEGLPVYFTIDAGPNVHLICEAKDEEVVVGKAREIVGIESIIINTPARGARLADEHLF